MLLFLKYWREKYKWPLNKTRVFSEHTINSLKDETSTSLRKGDPDLLRDALIKIHRWKTGGRTTNRYKNNLDGKEELVSYLLAVLPLENSLSSEFLNKLIDTLKIRQCNLPVASAQMSFILNRKTPIIDRFVTQFFSKKLSQRILEMEQFNMKNVFRNLKEIHFKIEDDGRGKCVPRLAVYYKSAYKRNKFLFIDSFIPELERISELSIHNNIVYQGIDNEKHNLRPIDVEMAIFAFGTQNREYYQCFYEGRTIPTIGVKLKAYDDV